MLDTRAKADVNEALFSERGQIDFDTYQEACAFGRKLERRGFVVHVNIPLPRLNILASVEECQGAHCHCRY